MQNETLIRPRLFARLLLSVVTLHCQRYIFHFSFFIRRRRLITLACSVALALARAPRRDAYVGATNGTLVYVGTYTPTGGRTPRNFALDPDGRWLVAANQNSSSLVVFRVNEKTGMLDRTGDPTVIPMPVCVLFVPSST